MMVVDCFDTYLSFLLLLLLLLYIVQRQKLWNIDYIIIFKFISVLWLLRSHNGTFELEPFTFVLMSRFCNFLK